jgi:pSer/pThr/pTyr-binding forkhead associated (FHA) protein
MPHLQIVTTEDPAPVHELTEEKTTIGRLPDNTIQIDDGSVSSHHAELILEGERYHLHDLGSTNGTTVNGETITDAILRNGDEVRFGTVQTVFVGEAEEAESSQPLPESAPRTTESASQSARPANFVNSSPTPKNVRKGDPVGVILLVVGGLALLAGAGVIGLLFSA